LIGYQLAFGMSRGIVIPTDIHVRHRRHAERVALAHLYAITRGLAWEAAMVKVDAIPDDQVDVAYELALRGDTGQRIDAAAINKMMQELTQATSMPRNRRERRVVKARKKRR
jgi:hypothetical protein